MPNITTEEIDDIFGTGRRSLLTKLEKKVVYTHLNGEPFTRTGLSVLNRIRSKLNKVVSVDYKIIQAIMRPVKRKNRTKKTVVNNGKIRMARKVL